MARAYALSADDLRGLRWASAAVLAGGALAAQMAPGVGLPCPLRNLTGLPCPFCGLQTSVKATLALDWAGALAATPAGIAVVVLAAWLLARRPAALRVPLWPVVAALVAMWTFQLHRYGWL